MTRRPLCLDCLESEMPMQPGSCPDPGCVNGPECCCSYEAATNAWDNAGCPVHEED